MGTNNINTSKYKLALLFMNTDIVPIIHFYFKYWMLVTLYEEKKPARFNLSAEDNGFEPGSIAS